MIQVAEMPRETFHTGIANAFRNISDIVFPACKLLVTFILGIYCLLTKDDEQSDATDSPETDENQWIEKGRTEHTLAIYSRPATAL
jgi:hypothetical protein